MTLMTTSASTTSSSPPWLASLPRDATIEGRPGSSAWTLRGLLSRAARSGQERPALTAFAIALAAAVIVALVQGEKFFFFDSGGYWYLSETFVRNGHFSLFNFVNSGLRGYALPLLYWALRNAGELLSMSNSLAVRMVNAATFALIGAVLAPRLAAIAWPQTSWNVTRRLALSGLVLVFWSGYLSYPLSDFPALAFGLLALVAIFRGDSPPWLLVAGLSAGLAINIRPSYVLLAPVLVALLVWDWVEQPRTERASVGRRGLSVAVLVVGLAIVAVPQSIIQHRQFGDYSPLPGSSALTQLQYRAGLELQRYDTYLEGTGRLEYVEPHTADIVAGLGSSTVDSIAYLKIVLRHPVTMAGLFLRHTVDGLDPRYTTPYIETLEMNRSGFSSAAHQLLRIAGFLIVFIAFVRVFWPAGRRSLGPARWRYLVALLVVSVTAAPSAMEARFLLPVYVVVWLLVMAPGWSSALKETRAGPHRYSAPALVLGAGLAYAVIVWAIISAATENLRLG